MYFAYYDFSKEADSPGWNDANEKSVLAAMLREVVSHKPYAIFKGDTMSRQFLILTLLLGIFPAGLVASPADLAAEAERVYAAFDNSKALEIYQQIYRIAPEYPNILFRMVRSHVDGGEALADKGDDSAKRHYERALHYAKLALEQFPDDAEAHVLMATALGRMALFSGGKQKVRYSRQVKEHLDRALELDPDSAQAHVVMGAYHREVATLNWFLRKFAVKLFGGLPKVSLEDSLKHTRRALELRPDWIYAYLSLGETYWEMGQKAKARGAGPRALELPLTDHRDRIYQAEASKRPGLARQ